MAEIYEPKFSETDIRVLENVTEEELQGYIDFLRDYKEVMWRNGDTGELVPESELMPTRGQSLPRYPEELKRIGMRFTRMEVGGRGLMQEEGFFDSNSFAVKFAGTLFSPTLICSTFRDAYSRDCFCDGLFGIGVANGLYLKMMLHLQDCLRYYNYSK